ncbi:hypothetical protein HGM15179_015371 [Zosterops borbonicus]|uniref:Forkhead box protein G1 n=1 Tax=Zosterops borbonicus TaxID=364589 RepID=A0A8K1LF79_9PASS|nr:hypothetical protein HGM15179_015371 [Zosterops borbonicus]
MSTASPGPAPGAQPQPGSGEKEERRSSEPDLLWLINLTGADIGLPPIPQDPDDRCTIWENLVSLVDFQCPGFPLTSEELSHYIDIPRAPASSSSSAPSAVTAPPAPAVPWTPPPPQDIDYSTNPHVRPPYSYATLICMALEASHKPKLTLAEICKWIRDNFSYFRRAHPSWQSSIRHNLCINKRFVKVPRDKGEPGRGAYWKLHPQYAEWLKTSSSDGRGAPAEQIPPVSGRRAPERARRVPSPARSGLQVGAELQRLLQEFEEFESGHNSDPAGNEEGQECPQPSPRAEGQECPQPSPRAEGQEYPQPCPTAEEQNYHPQPCPTAQGQEHPQPCPGAPGEAPAQPSSAPDSPEEAGDLTELKTSADWEALFSRYLEPEDFSTLELPAEPFPPGQPQTLPEPGLARPGLDETLSATAFLEAAWSEGIPESLPSCFSSEQGDGNSQAALAGTDGMGWDSLDPLKSLLGLGDDVNFDWM